jgi:hypothetical protein
MAETISWRKKSHEIKAEGTSCMSWRTATVVHTPIVCQSSGYGNGLLRRGSWTEGMSSTFIVAKSEPIRVNRK